LSAIPPDSTYFLEIVNKSRPLYCVGHTAQTTPLVLWQRDTNFSCTPVRHALHNTRRCSEISLSLFYIASSLASVFFRLASILGNLEVRRLLPRRVALLNANAPVNYEGGPTCSDYAFLNARAEEVREMSVHGEGYRKAARLLIS